VYRYGEKNLYRKMWYISHRKNTNVSSTVERCHLQHNFNISNHSSLYSRSHITNLFSPCETQEEKQMPIDTQEEATLRALLAASLCAAGCRVLETDLRKPTCEFEGTCRQCLAVEHRKLDLFSAQGAFYAAHREEVDESHRLAHAKWKEWLNSWNGSGGGQEAGAARRPAIMQELAALITARS
jgi:hypothetical protein